MKTARFPALVIGLLVLAGCTTTCADSASSERAAGGDGPTAIKVMESRLIYLPGQTGGHSYLAVASW
jgi:hypothetical protein